MSTKITITVRVEGGSFAHTSDAEIEIDADDEATAELPTRTMAESCRDMLMEQMDLAPATPKVLS